NQKVEKAAALLKVLEKKGLVEVEDRAEDRDPLRVAAARLRVEFGSRTEDKLPKLQRELLAYLELHSGRHNLGALESAVPKASTSVRALARRGLVSLAIEPVAITFGPPRPAHTLNAHQQAAYSAIEDALAAGGFQAFLLEGVTGSG